VFEKFMTRLINHPQVRPLLSDQHFLVDGTLIEAWATRSGQRAVRPCRSRQVAACSSNRTVRQTADEGRGVHRIAFGGISAILAMRVMY
jgi:hypothetical protein